MSVTNFTDSYSPGVIDAALALKADKAIAIKEVTGDYVLTLADSDYLIKVNKGTAISVTTANLAYTNGTQIHLVGTGDGVVSFIAGTDTTIISAGGVLTLRLKYSAATLIKTDVAGQWLLTGDIA